jgi:hypothetical protein
MPISEFSVLFRIYNLKINKQPEVLRAKGGNFINMYLLQALSKSIIY